MRAVVVYEPALATTRLVAQAVALGLNRSVSVLVLSSSKVDTLLFGHADLLVVGTPAQLARATAPALAQQSELGSPGIPAGSPSATNGPGVREWIASLGEMAKYAAAFDTRVKGRAVFARRASKALARELAQHGMSVIVPPASFLVEETGQLVGNETRRAEAWGANLGGVLRTRRAAG
jgi:hypothetical protein